jgi:hypothetical protein
LIEADLEREVVKWAIANGGRALKLKIDNERGFPDRTIFLPDGEILIPELKRPGKSKKYEQQKRNIAWLQDLGFAAAFVDSLGELEELHREFYR